MEVDFWLGKIMKDLEGFASRWELAEGKAAIFSQCAARNLKPEIPDYLGTLFSLRLSS